jgi:hypothetical protein
MVCMQSSDCVLSYQTHLLLQPILFQQGTNVRRTFEPSTHAGKAQGWLGEEGYSLVSGDTPRGGPWDPSSTGQKAGARSIAFAASGALGLHSSTLTRWGPWQLEERVGPYAGPWALLLERHLRLVPLTEGPVNFHRAPMCGTLREAF